MKKLVVVGLWHQGVVASACMADFGYDVIAIDKNIKYINSLSKGIAPIFEPGLNDLLKRGLKNKNLQFTSDLKNPFFRQKIIMIMFDTLVDENDQSDLSDLFLVIEEIALNLENDCILYVTSQVPVGTCEKIRKTIESKNPSLKFDIAYSPENLRLGKAIELFRKPSLPVIGAENINTFDRVKNLLSPLKADWTYVNLKTAEMTKHALNSYLAVSVAFGNELGNLCDEIGANGHQIAKLLRLEPRVGKQAMLLPGLGFSGATLARDIQTLRSLSHNFELNSKLLDGVWNSNKMQNDLVIRKIKKIYNSLSGIHVTVLGLTYKPETSTLRRSASLEIINNMIKEEAVVSCHDPKANRSEVKSYSGFSFYEDIYSSLNGCQVLVLLTPWQDYKNIDFERIKDIMSVNPLIIDTSNMWDGDYLEGLGFTYFDIGTGRGVLK
jgi:UDPglucose 6-dehydrogenase